MKPLIIFLLCTFWISVTNAQWAHVYQGRTPANAFIAGYDTDGTPLCVARAHYGGGVYLGFVRWNSSQAYIPFGYQIAVDDFDVFVGTGRWIPANRYQFPSNAMHEGNDSWGNPLYIARAKIQGCLRMGSGYKNGVARIPWGGWDEEVENYEILIPRYTPKTKPQPKPQPKPQLESESGYNGCGN